MIPATDPVEIPACRLRALENAWADDAKLADACDSSAVLHWLRRTRSGLNTRAAQADVAAMIERTITEALESDPSFSDWCDEAWLELEYEVPDSDDDPECRLLLL